MLTRNRPKALGGLVAARTMEAAASSAMLPFIVLWAHRDIGLAGAAAGLLFVGQAIGEFGTGVLAGGLADRLGRRRVLMISTAGAAASYGLLAGAAAPSAAIVLFLVAGVFESAFHPTVAAMVGDVVEDSGLVRAFGMVRMGANVGRIVGPLLGAAAVAIGLSAVFVLATALLIGAFVVELTLLPRDALPPRGSGAPLDPDDREVPPGTLRALRSDRTLATIVIGGGLLSTTFAWWEADGLVLLRMQTDVGAGAWAALFTISAVVSILVQLPLSSVTQRVGVSRALLAGAALQGLGLGLLVFAGSGGYGVLVAAVVLMAVGEVVYFPTVSAAVTRLAHKDQRASYQAALSITEDIGTALGPTSGLALARVLTPIGLWSMGGVAAVCAGAITSRAARVRLRD